MTKVPSELLYTKDHEWVQKKNDGSYLVGITDHAQDSLGDVTFVEMPTVGDDFNSGEVFGVVESVKAASDLYMPIAGRIAEVNEDLNEAPEKVNTDPYSEGWMIRISPSEKSDINSLLDGTQYSSEIGRA